MKCPHCGTRLYGEQTLPTTDKYGTKRVRACPKCGFKAVSEERFIAEVSRRMK